MSTDWIAHGSVVSSDLSDDSSSIESFRYAFLPEMNNPRRNSLRTVLITSNNKGISSFVMSNGMTSCVTTPLDQAASTPLPLPTADEQLGNVSTDFILRGTGGRPDLVSNNKGCSHFMLANGLSSAPLTNSDILWMEEVAQCKPGALFSLFYREERAGTVSEHPFEPLARYKALVKTQRQPRGHKTWEHLEALRKSDPLIHLSSWLDLGALYDSIPNTQAYKAHQAALLRRASSRPWLTMEAVAQPWRTPAAEHAGRTTIDATRSAVSPPFDVFARGERCSSDSVMVLEPSAFTSTPLPVELEDAASSSDERESCTSPGSPGGSPTGVLDASLHLFDGMFVGPDFSLGKGMGKKAVGKGVGKGPYDRPAGMPAKGKKGFNKQATQDASKAARPLLVDRD